MKNIYLFFRTLLAWLGIILVMSFASLGILIISPWIPPQRFFPFLRGCCRRVIWIAGIQLKVTHAEVIDPRQAYVYMGNHINAFDHFVLVSALPQHLIGLGATWQFKIPIYGYILRRVGVLPLRRTNLEEAKKSIAEAAEIIRTNQISVGIMPEGTRSRSGELAPFKKGGFHLALDAQAPILPFTLKGAYAFQHKGSFLFHPGPVEIIFGSPIDTRQYTKDTLAELIQTVREQIAEPLEKRGDKIFTP